MNALGDGEEECAVLALLLGADGRINEQEVMAGARDVADAADVGVDRISLRRGCAEVVIGDFQSIGKELDEAGRAELRKMRK